MCWYRTVWEARELICCCCSLKVDFRRAEALPSAFMQDVWRSYWVPKTGLLDPSSLCSAGSPCRWPSPCPSPGRKDRQKGPGGSKGPELSHLVVLLEKQRQGLTFLSVLSAVPSLPWEGEREKESFS